jgi:hypothetical protein
LQERLSHEAALFQDQPLQLLHPELAATVPHIPTTSTRALGGGSGGGSGSMSKREAEAAKERARKQAHRKYDAGVFNLTARRQRGGPTVKSPEDGGGGGGGGGSGGSAGVPGTGATHSNSNDNLLVENLLRNAARSSSNNLEKILQTQRRQGIDARTESLLSGIPIATPFTNRYESPLTKSPQRVHTSPHAARAQYHSGMQYPPALRLGAAATHHSSAGEQKNVTHNLCITCTSSPCVSHALQVNQPTPS